MGLLEPANPQRAILQDVKSHDASGARSNELKALLKIPFNYDWKKNKAMDEGKCKNTP